MSTIRPTDIELRELRAGDAIIVRYDATLPGHPDGPTWQALAVIRLDSDPLPVADLFTSAATVLHGPWGPSVRLVFEARGPAVTIGHEGGELRARVADIASARPVALRRYR